LRHRIAVFEDLPSGGGRRALFEILRRINQKFTIDLYTFTTSENQFCRLDNLVEEKHVFKFQPSGLFNSPFGRLNQLQRIRDLRKLNQIGAQVAKRIDQQGYSLVFAHHCRWTQGPLLLRYLKTPSVYFCHEILRPLYDRPYRTEDQNSGLRAILDMVDPILIGFRRLAKWYDADAVRSADKVLVNSIFSQNIIRRTYGIHPEVSYLGVDLELFKPVEGSRSNYLISVGAIHPRKGFDFLIRSIGKLPLDQRLPLVIIGDSELAGEKEVLEKLASRSEVDLTIRIGISDSELIHHYRKARLMLYSPHEEPFGLAPVEAMACGLPVLAVNEGGVQETVRHQVTGLLVDRDPRKFAESLNQLVHSPERLESLGKMGRQVVVQQWSWDQAVRRIEQQLMTEIKIHRGEA
jgi:glycosyltransferase involved in cell wall biosynthesis